MRKFAGLVCTMALAASSLAAFGEADKAKLDERLLSARDVINEVMATPDKGIPQSILAGASCVVVIPSFKKGAFIAGAQYGQGVATCRTPNGWSSPVFVQLAGGSFGFQIGGQSTDLVLVAMNQNGLQDMLKSKFKIGGDAAAAAGPVGRNAQAGTDWKLNAEFLTYSRSKGLFAGIDLDGTVLSQNADDTRTFYGADVPFQTVLHGDKVVPTEAKPFVRTVAKYFVVSRDNQ
ncbi:lipid-binding SYLF domain-containing protein [Granulicella aggregans]|uniref:Lipid-binding SYLF domain-containing protein n=1 Tax=Granulicella aggregans TaxID=474949 RepID=A0A7W8E3U2_9BACT|nr:lipid-binding SYLF domain-containing protein [Granulicella aggregans]MBB5057589.1 lipid-binding SYLF domain-containing protein [Granulicella aggregans]